MARKLPIEIWSDVVCPWCYVGKRRFEAALAKFAHRDAVEVTWRAFELDPNAPTSYEGKGDYATRLAKKYGRTVPAARQMIESMTKTAAAEGLEFDFERSRTGNTFDAHRLLCWAHHQGKQDALKERLFKATFTDGEPIADREALVRLAAEVGLDAEQARAVLLSDQYTAEVRAEEEEAHALGVTGVPFFAIDGKYGVAGAQPPELLLQILERAWAEGERKMVSVGGGKVCNDEHCDVDHDHN